jgi:hypothetical protein
VEGPGGGVCFQFSTQLHLESIIGHAALELLFLAAVDDPGSQVVRNGYRLAITPTCGRITTKETYKHQKIINLILKSFHKGLQLAHMSPSNNYARFGVR